MKTLDVVWNEAEALVDPVPPASRIAHIEQLLKEWQLSTCEPEECAELMGKILFELAGLSKEFNVNISAALRMAVDDAKIDKFG